ncbi:MAG: hypothetical protein DBX51_05670 [Clostridiales bacterium]|nr:MAG: hypothetical protein DBX51_05670 [Clostridiales bacterium]
MNEKGERESAPRYDRKAGSFSSAFCSKRNRLFQVMRMMVLYVSMLSSRVKFLAEKGSGSGMFSVTAD